MAEQNQSDRRRVRWMIPTVNPRSASLRYRCLYPMAELTRMGRSVDFWQDGELIDAGLTLVFEGWSLFPTVNPLAVATALVEFAEKAAALGATIIVDNCDNQFASETVSAQWTQSLELLQRLAAASAVFVSCSMELQAVLRQNLRATVLHTVIDDPVEQHTRLDVDSLWKRVFSPQRMAARLITWRHALKLLGERVSGRLPLVWYGSHGNSFAAGGMLDLLAIRPALEDANTVTPISLTVISNNKRKFDENFAEFKFPVYYLEWNRVTFHALLRQHSIVVIPSSDNPFTRCKSSNRLTLAVHHGVAVIADAMPAYQPYGEVVGLGNWEANLKKLLASRMARQQQVAAAQQLVDERNAGQVIAKRWEALFFTNDQ